MFTHMDYIYEVYKERSFSNAAKKLYISQSSLSLTIKRAEDQIGMQIFDRSTYPIQLTEFGELYIHAIEEIRNIANSLTDYIYDVNHLQKGELSIGAGNFFATYLVAPAILSFKRKYPNISVKMLEGRTFDLERQLAAGNIDILVTNGVLDSISYKKTTLFEEHLLLAVPPVLLDSFSPPSDGQISFQELFSNQFSQKAGVDLSAFTQIPFIGMRQGNDSRIRTDKILADAGIQLNWIVELDQSSTAFRLSAAGMGACIVSDTVVRKLAGQSQLYLYKIAHPQTCRDVAVYTRKTGYVTHTMDAFLLLLKENAPLYL